jgi:predicted RNase H-like HicB family nuclease
MNNEQYIYPAIFHVEDNNGYSIEFPDLDGCFTCGNDLQDALYMAWDACAGWLSTAIKMNEPIPVASKIKDIKVSNEQDFVNLISVNLLEYKKKTNTKSVKKTLSIPAWLNDIAEEHSVNYSKVLQNALIEQLHVDNNTQHHI